MKAMPQLPPSGTPGAQNQGPSALAPPALQPAYGEREASAASRKNRCDGLAGALENLQDAERTGGSARHMDSLKKQRRDVETKMQAAGC